MSRMKDVVHHLQGHVAEPYIHGIPEDVSVVVFRHSVKGSLEVRVDQLRVIFRRGLPHRSDFHVA